MSVIYNYYTYYNVINKHMHGQRNKQMNYITFYTTDIEYYAIFSLNSNKNLVFVLNSRHDLYLNENSIWLEVI